MEKKNKSSSGCVTVALPAFVKMTFPLWAFVLKAFVKAASEKMASLQILFE